MYFIRIKRCTLCIKSGLRKKNVHRLSKYLTYMYNTFTCVLQIKQSVCNSKQGVQKTPKGNAGLTLGCEGFSLHVHAFWCVFYKKNNENVFRFRFLLK